MKKLYKNMLIIAGVLVAVFLLLNLLGVDLGLSELSVAGDKSTPVSSSGGGIK